MTKIGLVNIDTSHPFSFAEIMAAAPELDMQYTALYNSGFRGEAELQWFADKYDLTVTDSIDALAELTDIGFIQSCNWDDHLAQAMAFIRRGKPVFLDKPIVGSYADIQRVRELLERGAVILGSSSARYASEIQEFLATPIDERGEIVSIYASCGVDEFNYGVHVGEILSELAGAKAVACRFVSVAENAGGRAETYQVRFANGVTGTYTICTTGWRPFDIAVMTTKGSYIFKIDSSRIYRALLDRLSATMKTGERLTTDVETLLNVTEFMLCGKKSRDEANGAEVAVADLADGDAFDGGGFEKGYAAGASVLYKD